MSYPARLILTAALMVLSWAGCGSGIPEGDSRVRSDGDVVRVSLGEIGEKRGDYFNYTTSSGTRVDFLVYRETSGSYRAVFDACRKCYRWRKGYVIDGDAAVCRKCGERHDLDGLREGRGSCVPIALPSNHEKDSLVIPVSELEAGARYF